VLGFRYTEELHGGFYFLSTPVDERAADLRLDVAVPDVAAFGQLHTAELRGPLKLEGFADARGADVQGKLVLDLEGQRALYELSFTGGDDAHPVGRYRLRGYKQFELLNLVDSFTLVRASLYDADAREIGRAMLRFDARGNWASLVRSFRLAW
jgi:hypothetical protein